MSWLVVSLHDVATATAEPSRRWMDLFEARGLQASVLVVPGPWQGHGPVDGDRSLCSWLRTLQASRHDIAQHGWSHVEPAVSNRGIAARLAGRLVAVAAPSSGTSTASRRRGESGSAGRSWAPQVSMSRALSPPDG